MDAEVIHLFDGRAETKPPAPANADVPLLDRIAAVLNDIVDEPLQRINDAGSNAPRDLELRLAHFRPDLAERAAAVLEEAGW